MRFLVMLVIVVVGCVVTLPDDPTLSADIAAETARMVLQMQREVSPTPPPSPENETCETCNGTGKMPTDGRIVIQCNACGGTGKKPKSVCLNCEAAK